VTVDQLIQIVPCIDRDACDLVLDSVDSSAFSTSPMLQRGAPSGLTVNTTYRSSTSHLLDESSNAARILHDGMNRSLLVYKDRLCRLNQIFDGYPIPGGHGVRSRRESIQILRYEPGQFYVFHHDASEDTRRYESRRTLAIIVYLTDSFEGGSTEFLSGQYRPAKGEALIFPAVWTHPHKGQEVTSGTKFTAVSWYYSELR
jgi:hypothetical protein